MIYLLIALAIVIVAASVWFLARPLARGAHAESREEHFQLLTVRDRLLAQLNELDIDERDRGMEADTVADERARMEAHLAEVLKQLDAYAPPAPGKKATPARTKKLWRWVVVTLALAVPSVATGLFFFNLTVPLGQIAQVAGTPADGGMPDPMQMVARLEQRLQQNPDDPQGWLRLGRSYAVLGRLDDAKAAYEHAYRILPKGYEPDSAEAFWFLGLAAYSQGDTARALDFWQRLHAGLPPESDAAQQLKHVMEQARKQGAKK